MRDGRSGKAGQVKPDEIAFLRLCAADPRRSARDIINTPGFPMHHKRAWFLLEKWARLGWYDYGVSVDTGWMEPTGVAKAAPGTHSARSGS
jgi:hypothetical protein